MSTAKLTFDQEMELVIEKTLKVLRREGFTRAEWQELFQIIYSIAGWRGHQEEEVYNAVGEVVKSTIKHTKAKIVIHQDDEAFIKEYVAEWEEFFKATNILSKPFAPLTTKKWEHDMDNFNVRQLMLRSWNEVIFAELAPRVHTSAMNLIDAERNGKECDLFLITKVRISDIDVCFVPGDKYFNYREIFEKEYIDATRAFYQKEVSEVSMADGVVNYMKYADRRLFEEIARADKYLDKESLSQLCVDLLVVPVQDAILGDCERMIERNDIENLQRMFRLMNSTSDGIAAMLGELEKFTVKTCLADLLVAAESVVENAEKYVQRLIDLLNRFAELIEVAFQNDPRFLSSRDTAFGIVVNDTTIFKLELAVRNKMSAESKCPELLASFCDSLLRKTKLSKKLTCGDVESRLKDVILLLKYAENKDVFMIYYKSHLTRRLILDTTADLDKEAEMIGWLKDVGMPADHVHRVTQMFKDIRLSADINQNFRQTHPKINDSINTKVFTATVWARRANTISVTLPVELEDYVCEMEKYYKSRYNGRKLSWDHQLSSATVTFVNAVGKFDLDVTTFQMTVLFAWNERPNERISFEDLRLATELPEAQLRKTLWSLVATTNLKRNVVLCESEVKSPLGFDCDSQFWINDEFGLVRKLQKRGKVNLIGRLQLSTEVKEEENEEIVVFRELRVQEALIRVLKTRKSVASDKLQLELIGLLRNMFVPTKRMIKEQVEWCVENNFIGRDKSDHNLLMYVA